MLNSGDIIYGFAKHLHTPKNKYAISKYCDNDINILIQFTTSQPRAGVAMEDVLHGAIYKDGDCLSYVFEKDVVIGIDPQNGTPFAFPVPTIMAFDYGFLNGQEKFLLDQFDNPITVCKLDEKEYIELIYAMRSSSRIKVDHKPYLDRILYDYYKDN